MCIFRSVKRAFVDGVLSLVYCALEEHGGSVWDVLLELELDVFSCQLGTMSSSMYRIYQSFRSIRLPPLESSQSLGAY